MLRPNNSTRSYPKSSSVWRLTSANERGRCLASTASSIYGRVPTFAQHSIDVCSDEGADSSTQYDDRDHYREVPKQLSPS